MMTALLMAGGRSRSDLKWHICTTDLERGARRKGAAVWNNTSLILYMNLQVYPQTNSDAKVHFYNYNSSLTSLPF